MKTNFYNRITNIKNNYLSKNKTVRSTYLKKNKNLLKYLIRDGFINSFVIEKQKIDINLNFDKFSNSAINVLEFTPKN
jgi:ribosomal protein S8